MRKTLPKQTDREAAKKLSARLTIHKRDSLPLQATHAEANKHPRIAPGLMKPGEVLQLQRVLGNKAVRKLVVSQSAPRTSMIQRNKGVEKGSNDVMAKVYNDLLEKSKTFKALSDTITAEKAIKLDMNKKYQNEAGYIPGEHAIYVNTDAAFRILGSEGNEGFYKWFKPTLIFEMHNAKYASKFSGYWNESKEIKEKFSPVLIEAVRALQIEWREWLNTVETHISVGKIKKESPQEMADRPALSIFPDYLEDAVRTGHVKKLYDETAEDENWIGFAIFEEVEQGNEEHMAVTHKEKSGNDPLNKENPFEWSKLDAEKLEQLANE